MLTANVEKSMHPFMLLSDLQPPGAYNDFDSSIALHVSDSRKGSWLANRRFKKH